MKNDNWFEPLTPEQYEDLKPFFEQPESLLLDGGKYVGLLCDLRFCGRLGISAPDGIDASVEIFNVMSH
jgi:hypothetical protein